MRSPKNWAAPRDGNYKTMKYHNKFCDHYDCKTCTKIFKTKAAAEKQDMCPAESAEVDMHLIHNIKFEAHLSDLISKG